VIAKNAGNWTDLLSNFHFTDAATLTLKACECLIFSSILISLSPSKRNDVLSR
jgi:hypothetical protein